MVNIDLKEFKSLPILIRCIFLFGGSIIGTLRLSVPGLEQFYVR